ncbi:hypothetical protein EYF80_059887 [Liparis tanakae]|uniref:Uncharacterized protein n=1 Tax=Liparis tanakae TaxID=230148 RepID=A0A4Z2EM79_9TELE|nr:hypothetical protein EYF80_059887 [Liparis tanakae]
MYGSLAKTSPPSSSSCSSNWLEFGSLVLCNQRMEETEVRSHLSAQAAGVSFSKATEYQEEEERSSPAAGEPLHPKGQRTEDRGQRKGKPRGLHREAECVCEREGRGDSIVVTRVNVIGPKPTNRREGERKRGGREGVRTRGGVRQSKRGGEIEKGGRK